MRILAIRGCNLASLAGDFEIDLARGPLGAAGVFAITGPTGAGKSTLLDAMCVALFDRTPRLTNRSTVVVGRGDDDPTALGAQDVRSLLRRGATTGWAEVDFESGDTRRYRARWSVRRARGASDGRFQDQQVTLQSLDGDERLGGTRTETLKAIHERLGLSFDQFRRSALLAQGEFAAFLRADGRDRSELLERMTGTEIYSRLSVAAHVRAQVAMQRLRELHGALAAIPVLEGDARAAAESELAGAGVAREAARLRLHAAEAAARWLVEAQQRERALAEAVAASTRAGDAIVAAEGARAELALRRRAEPLRAAREEAARLERQLVVARGEVAAAERAVESATRAMVELAARRARLGELHAPLRAARLAAGVVERTGVAGREVEERALAAAGDAAWLVEHHELAREVAGWRRLDEQCEQLEQLGRDLTTADAALARHAHERAELARKRAAVDVQERAAVNELEQARREASRFGERRGLSLEEAGKRESAARADRDDSVKLVQIADEARGAATARGELAHQLAELETAHDVDTELRAIIEQERATAETLRGERERVLVELRRAAGYAHARTELVEGDPCPLCGALEHPWHDRGAFDEVIGDAELRLADTAHLLAREVGELAQLAARDDHRARERRRLTACLATADQTLERARAKWRDQLAGLGELALVADPDAPGARELAAARTAAAAARLEAATTARSESEAFAKASLDAQAVIVTRQGQVAARGEELRAADAELARIAATIERLAGERTAKDARERELRAAIDEAVARWPVDAAGVDVAGVRTALAGVAARWRGAAERVADADAMVAAALAVVDGDARELERNSTEHAARCAEATRGRDRLAGELAEAASRLDTARAAAGFAAEELRALLADEPARATELADQLAALDRAADLSRTLVAERRRLAGDHAAARPPELDDATRVDELAAAVVAADHRAAAAIAALAADDAARARRDAARADVAAGEQRAEIDRVLGEVIGSHDGKLFRSFAQSLTLDGLLAVANSHLEELAPRYQLERVPKHDLELQVIDRELGSEIRSVQSLSGGESFLVSLALALGLSSMSAHDVRVRTLLIDEGFGTLDPATLDSALAVLDALQATGRQVGVISHVPALVERVGAHVRVAPRGGGRSEVIVA